MADYIDDGERILIFCSPELWQQLCNVKEYFIDATFKSCPKPFTQLLSIHGDFGSTQETINVKPLVFALMLNKKQKTYEKIFHLIQSQIAQITEDDNSKWTMSMVHCDFELAIINVIAKFFPNAEICGCYYHWCKNMWRKGKLLGHNNRKSERRIVSLAAALPLLPKTQILEGLKYISDEAEVLNLQMPKFFKYLERYR